MNLKIEELNRYSHNRLAFDCGTEQLNDFLKSYASQHQQKNISRSYVAVPSNDTDNLKAIAGYYTLSSGQIFMEELSENLKSKLPRHPVPIARLGRLAVDKSCQGQGIGKYLLCHALTNILDISKKMGVFAVIVDAKNDNAKEFYERYGFAALQNSERTLFLPVETIKIAQHMEIA